MTNCSGRLRPKPGFVLVAPLQRRPRCQEAAGLLLSPLLYNSQRGFQRGGSVPVGPLAPPRAPDVILDFNKQVLVWNQFGEPGAGA